MRPADKIEKFLKKHPKKFFKKSELIKRLNLSMCETSSGLKCLMDRKMVETEHDGRRTKYKNNEHTKKRDEVWV